MTKRLLHLFLILAPLLLIADEKHRPDHLMIGPGLFNVDKSHPRWMAQIEYRFEPNCHHVRPLIAFFANTDQSFYLCGGVGFDIFLCKKFVVTPSFAPGWYHQGKGRRLGFPVNFRSGIEAAIVLENQGRIGAQFSHISNARMLLRNPGADSLVIYYAIPL
ncbi:MAG: acyloxyacyl hydrolase [Chlamydiales bacterium]|nr:acyloxyacyl hydrolase [Chlamydiales bacterium]